MSKNVISFLLGAASVMVLVRVVPSLRSTVTGGNKFFG